jgi:hypothetical protein
MDQITDADRENLKKAFDMFDIDGSGEIDVDEMELAMKALGMDVTHDEVHKLIMDADEDHSGEIGFDEFVEIMSLRMMSDDAKNQILNAVKGAEEGVVDFTSVSAIILQVSKQRRELANRIAQTKAEHGQRLFEHGETWGTVGEGPPSPHSVSRRTVPPLLTACGPDASDEEEAEALFQQSLDLSLQLEKWVEPTDELRSTQSHLEGLRRSPKSDWYATPWTFEEIPEPKNAHPSAAAEHLFSRSARLFHRVQDTNIERSKILNEQLSNSLKMQLTGLTQPDFRATF